MNFIKNSLIVFVNTFWKAFEIKRRSNRKEYIIFCILSILISYLVANITLSFNSYNGIISLLVFICCLLNLIPYSTLTIRRLHDCNLKGWWYIVILPLSVISVFIEIKMKQNIWFKLVMLYLMLLHLFLILKKGTFGINKYGEEQKN